MKYFVLIIGCIFSFAEISNATSVMSEFVPLVIRVRSESTKLPISGANVQMECDELKKGLKFELDKDTLERLKLASKGSQTNGLGYAFQYGLSSGGVDTRPESAKLPRGRSRIKGTLIVSAKGYATKRIPVDIQVTIENGAPYFGVVLSEDLANHGTP